MKNRILDICGITIGVIFATLPITMVISYFTYTEKPVMITLLAMLIICSIPILIDYIKSK